MKNYGVLVTAFGSPDVLQYAEDLAYPTCGDDEVIVEVHYASVNPVDCKTRQGLGWGAEKFGPLLPCVLGFDLSGVVVEAGKNARFNLGDKVAGANFAGGAYQRYSAVNCAFLAKVPENVSLLQAAALPTVGGTAIQLVEAAKIQPGEHVLLSAPLGGVGHIALQLLAKKDCQITVITSQKHWPQAKAYGAQDWIDYQDEFPDYAGVQADILLDLVGGKAGERALLGVALEGRAICLPTIFVPQLQAAGKEKGITVQGILVKPSAELMAQALTLLARAEFELLIAKTYPLQDLAQAQAEVENGHVTGKLVIEIAPK